MQAFDLPPITEQLVELIGYEQALAMAEALGGRSLYVPLTPSPKLLNIEKLSEESVKRLCDEMGGVVIDSFPKRLLLESRDNTIRSLRPSMSLSELSKKFKLTTRQIINICNEDDGMNSCHRPSNQYHLF